MEPLTDSYPCSQVPPSFLSLAVWSPLPTPILVPRSRPAFCPLQYGAPYRLLPLFPGPAQLSVPCSMEPLTDSYPCSQVPPSFLSLAVWSPLPTPTLVPRSRPAFCPLQYGAPYRLLPLFPGPAQLSVPCSMEPLTDSYPCSQVPPSFLSLAVWKSGKSIVSLFSCEHDVIRKWRKFAELARCILRIVQPTTHSTVSVYDSCLLLAGYIW